MRPSPRQLPALLAGLLLVAAPAHADDLVRKVLDLSPERIAACQQALHEFLAPSPMEVLDGPQLVLESRYSPDDPPALREGVDDPVSVGGSLLLPDEEFFIQGREEDYRDAAERWLLSSLKGSDAASAARGSRFHGSVGWSGGPSASVGVGPVSVRVGDGGDWRVRFSRRSRVLGGPWRTSAWVGERDGDTIAGFTIGRSLLASRR